MSPRYHEEELSYVRRLIERMWLNAGASQIHAERVSRVVTLADRLGKHQQGIGVLEVLYPGWVAGDIDFAAEPEVAEEGPAWTVIEGNRSTGFNAITMAMEATVEKAATTGIAVGLCRNHWDAGCFGGYSLIAEERGMVGLATNTTPPMSTPIGGIDNVMSAAPLSLAAPAREGEPPILVDVKTSETYEGELTEAILEGRPHTAAVLVDPETGELTDDPAPYREHFDEGEYSRFAHYACGLTFASHRQQSMNVMVEMLCALVPGGLVTPDLPADMREFESAAGEGPTTVPASFVMAIDPGVFTPGGQEEYRKKVGRYRDAVKSVARRPGSGEVHLPGERGLSGMTDDPEQPLRMLKIHWDAFLYWAGRFGVDVAAERTT